MSAFRVVVRDRLAARGWEVFMSGFAGGPAPTLFLDPAAPAEVEAVLADLVEEGLVIERARLTLHLEQSPHRSPRSTSRRRPTA